jgi:hypothetical protein
MNGGAGPVGAEEPTAERRDGSETLAGRLVGDAPTASWTREGARLLAGLGLAGLYGVALGARQGGAALVTNALGVPLAIAAVYLVAVPAFAIVLALIDAPVALERVAAVATRAAASTGLVLAGLAPAAAVFATTSATAGAAAAAAGAGLALAGGVGLLQLREGLVAESAGADSATRGLVALATVAFAAFAAVLAARVWWGAVPALDARARSGKTATETAELGAPRAPGGVEAIAGAPPARCPGGGS